MEISCDYKKFAILYVDDEERALKYFAAAFEPTFRILTATNAADGFQILQEHKDKIALLMTDQRMPGEQGVRFLEKARRLSPRTLRILATAYTDIDTAIEAVNSGAIYKYVAKPWRIPELEMTLRRGVEFFVVQRERDQLLSERLPLMQNLIIADRVASLSVLAAGLNHHFRNSLVAIRTFLDLVPSKLKEENVDVARSENRPFWTDFYAQVQTQVTRITEMLTELEGTAQRGRFDLRQPVSLPEVIARAAENLRERMAKKRIVLETEFPETLPRLQADPLKIQRLFELLLTNEILISPEDSRISFLGRSVPRGNHSDSAIELEVHDQSAGLPGEAAPSMFDPFLTHALRHGEFGINLLTCFFIVYHHGGNVEIKSRAGGGVTYAFAFPTNPMTSPVVQDDQGFLAKALLTETLWDKLLAGDSAYENASNRG